MNALTRDHPFVALEISPGVTNSKLSINLSEQQVLRHNKTCNRTNAFSLQPAHHVARIVRALGQRNLGVDSTRSSGNMIEVMRPANGRATTFSRG